MALEDAALFGLKIPAAMMSGDRTTDNVPKLTDNLISGMAANLLDKRRHIPIRPASKIVVGSKVIKVPIIGSFATATRYTVASVRTSFTDSNSSDRVRRSAQAVFSVICGHPPSFMVIVTHDIRS